MIYSKLLFSCHKSEEIIVRMCYSGSWQTEVCYNNDCLIYYCLDIKENARFCNVLIINISKEVVSTVEAGSL